MGFEVKKGRYVTFTKEELEELRPDSTRSIEVDAFVALDDIDPIFYERTYWLGPADDAAKKAYQLLLAAMEDRERAGIGSVVMRNKQYLAAVRPLDGALAMSTMRFADEVVPRADVEGVPSRRSKPEPKTLALATQIIDSLEADWHPEKYHDTYAEELRSRIEARHAGKDIVEEPPAEAEADVLDLMAALERSVESARRGRTKRKQGARKRAKASA
jgi:DNA end-binding protein Ku